MRRNRFPGAIPCRPRKEHNHQPSRPLGFCSKTVNISPRWNESSSGVSAELSYNALARQFYLIEKNKQGIINHLKIILTQSTITITITTCKQLIS